MLTRVNQRYPVIPLYGDMQTNVVVILKKSKGFDERLWTMAQLSDTKLAIEYELIHHLDVLRERHETYLAKWTTMINEVNVTLIRCVCTELITVKYSDQNHAASGQASMVCTRQGSDRYRATRHAHAQ